MGHIGLIKKATASNEENEGLQPKKQRSSFAPSVLPQISYTFFKPLINITQKIPPNTLARAKDEGKRFEVETYHIVNSDYDPNEHLDELIKYVEELEVLYDQGLISPEELKEILDELTITINKIADDFRQYKNEPRPAMLPPIAVAAQAVPYPPLKLALMALGVLGAMIATAAFVDWLIRHPSEVQELDKAGNKIKKKIDNVDKRVPEPAKPDTEPAPEPEPQKPPRVYPTPSFPRKKKEDDEKKKQYPVTLYLPPEKHLYADIYQRLLDARQLQHEPGRNRDCKQRSKWKRNIKEIIFETVLDRGKRMGLTQKQIINPYWTRTRPYKKAVPVDHKIEWQVRPLTQNKWVDDPWNFELLDEACNISVGPAIQGNIARERKILAAAYKDPSWLSKPITFTKLVLEGSARLCDRWNEEEIAKGVHLNYFKDEYRRPAPVDNEEECPT